MGNIGFQGELTDPDTGLVDMGARWYDPSTGSFISRDPMTYASGRSVLANRYTYGAAAPLDFVDPDGQWPRWVNKVASAVGRGARAVASAVGRGARAVASAVTTGVSYAAHYARAAADSVSRFARSALDALSRATQWAYHKSGLAKVVDTVKGAWRAASAKAGDWAKRQAAAAWQKAQQAKAAVTRAAKAAVAKAIRYTPLPALAAATKPLLKGFAKVVSSTAKLAANVVVTTAVAIKDPDKFAASLYNKAVEQAGVLIESVSKAADAVVQFTQDHAGAIAGIAAGLVVGVGCGVAIGWTGVGAVACGALAGAVGAAVTGYINGQRGWDLAASTLSGAAFGALTGGLFSVGGAAVGAAARSLVSGVRSGATGLLRTAGGKAANAAAAEVRAIAGARPTGGLATRGASCNVTRNSFTAGTLVLMTDGRIKPISEVRVGDLVLATDPVTGATGPRAVTAVITGTGVKNLVDVTVDTDGSAGERSAIITATDEHPFWVANLNRWVYARDLNPGYRFQTTDHRDATVADIHSRQQRQTVHNFSVDDIHTYYVLAGDSPVLVHNCGGGVPCRCLPASGRESPNVGPILSRNAMPGEEFNMVLSQGQPASRPGGFGTSDDIPHQAYARDQLAIRSDWKPDVSVVQRYRIPEGGAFRIQESMVGPQYDPGIGRILPGGGTQLEILNYADRARLIPVGEPIELLP